MIIRKAFKFRLNLPKHRENLFFQFSGACRFVWNKCLSLNLSRLENKQRIMRYQELDFWCKLWKNSDDYGFLKNCHSQLLQQKLKDLDRAFMDCFDKSQPNKRLPCFKRRNRHHSFRYPQGFKINGNNIFLPKLGWFRFRQSQKIIGTPKNVTLSYYSGHWTISVQTEYEADIPKHASTTMVGIDRGITNFAVLSNGIVFQSRNYFTQRKQQLKQAQRALARKVKFSNNWRKQLSRVQKIHAKIANSRRDYLHWCSTQISKNHAVIVLEDLKVTNMSRSAKGTVDEPGKNVKAKAGLNRAILDQGWSEFKRQLQYKSEWMGGEVLLVNPKYTSQTCPKCQHRDSDNRQTQAQFECMACGYKEHADRVGAINVCRAGHAQLACGDWDLSWIGPDDIEHRSAQAQESSRVAA